MACGYGRRRSQHEGDGSDEQRQPQQARYVHERPRACLNAPKRQAQAPECGCEPLHGPVRAVGGLLHAANRRMIGRSEAGIWEMSLYLRVLRRLYPGDVKFASALRSALEWPIMLSSSGSRGATELPDRAVSRT
jgi:hypothetical protein